jgi:hypothetical protein
MWGPKSLAGITVKIFIKEHEIIPIWVFLKLFIPSMDGPDAIFVSGKYFNQSVRDIFRHDLKGD